MSQEKTLLDTQCQQHKRSHDQERGDSPEAGTSRASEAARPSPCCLRVREYYPLPPTDNFFIENFEILNAIACDLVHILCSKCHCQYNNISFRDILTVVRLFPLLWSQMNKVRRRRRRYRQRLDLNLFTVASPMLIW